MLHVLSGVSHKLTPVVAVSIRLFDGDFPGSSIWEVTFSSTSLS